MATLQGSKNPPVAPGEPLNGALSPAPPNVAVKPPVMRGGVALGAPGAVVAVAARPPTAMACLHCQLIGKRRLTCTRADVCAELPHVFAIGPLLLGGWLVMTIAFLLAVR